MVKSTRSLRHWADRQNSVLPHKVIRNSALFQGNLLKRLPLSPLQRIGKLLIAFFFVAVGIFFLAGAVSDFRSAYEINPFGLMMSILFVAMGFGLGVKLTIDVILAPKR